MNQSVSRAHLYSEVWAEPMTTVAKRYGVSSSYLARVCKWLRVPRPPRGYWAKLAVGKAMPQVPLPEPEPGDELEWNGASPPHSAPRERSPRRPTSDNPEGEAAQRKGIHSLIRQARLDFAKVRKTHIGYLRPYRFNVVHVFVTEDQLDAALTLANKLFRFLEGKGHRVRLAGGEQSFRGGYVDHRMKSPKHWDHSDRENWRPAKATLVFFGNTPFGLAIFEPSESVEMRYVDGKYIRADAPRPRRSRYWDSGREWTTFKDTPTGRLSVRAYSPYGGVEWSMQWDGGSSAELVNQFEAIESTLVAAIPKIAELVERALREQEEHARRVKAEMDEIRRRDAARRRVELTKTSREDLLRIVDKWVLATRIEQFFENVLSGAKELPTEEQQAILKRVARGRKLLGSMDAFEQFRHWRMPPA